MILKYLNATITYTHVPTSGKDEEQKDAFLEHLEWLHLKVPEHNTKNIVMGYFNATTTMFLTQRNVVMHPNIRKHILHKKNNNGKGILDFAVTRSTTVSSTLFQHKSIHLQIWKSPNCISLIHHAML
jgi:hypothetical protein